jgi:hypothetical protein
MGLLSIVEDLPRSGEKNKSTEDQNVAENVKRIKMRIDLPSDQGIP